MQLLTRIVAIVFVLLGGLWLLQGIGAVHIRPILCVANCAPVQGPSPAWAVAGLLLTAGGGWLLLRERANRR